MQLIRGESGVDGRRMGMINSFLIMQMSVVKALIVWIRAIVMMVSISTFIHDIITTIST